MASCETNWLGSCKSFLRSQAVTAKAGRNHVICAGLCREIQIFKRKSNICAHNLGDEPKSFCTLRPLRLGGSNWCNACQQQPGRGLPRPTTVGKGAIVRSGVLVYTDSQRNTGVGHGQTPCRCDTLLPPHCEHLDGCNAPPETPDWVDRGVHPFTGWAGYRRDRGHQPNRIARGDRWRLNGNNLSVI